MTKEECKISTVLQCICQQCIIDLISSQFLYSGNTELNTAKRGDLVVDMSSLIIQWLLPLFMKRVLKGERMFVL